jgi:hypothetical protein
MIQDPEKADLEINTYDNQVNPVQSQDNSSIKSKKDSKDEDSVHSRSSSDTIEPVLEAAAETPPQKSKSRSSSVRSRRPTVVPRSKRRGLLGRFSIIPEVDRPHDYTRKTKWLITFIVALAAAAAPLGSAIFYRVSYTPSPFPQSPNRRYKIL